MEDTNVVIQPTIHGFLAVPTGGCLPARMANRFNSQDTPSSQVGELRNFWYESAPLRAGSGRETGYFESERYLLQGRDKLD